MKDILKTQIEKNDEKKKLCVVEKRENLSKLQQ